MSGLSVCTISKNSALHIAGMLESVRELSDDLIVVDTGSTDNSKEIAIESGARVENLAWTNDFSIARNYSISLARHPWILVLDCDETLDATAVPSIRNLIKQKEYAFALNRYHYTSCALPAITMKVCMYPPALALGATNYYVTKDFRLFSKDPRVVYMGVVHESIEDSARLAKFKIEYTDLVIHHYGHLASAEDRLKKTELYMSLAIENTLKHPDDWRTFFHAGAELQALGRHTEAIQYYRQASNLYANSNKVWRQLGISLCASGDFIEGLNALRSALSLNSACSLTWLAMGETFIQIQHFDAAVECFRAILQANPNHEAAKANLEFIESKIK